ncbi:hypothetical protein GCM10022286_25150 [Gryllotalpicola daejeonensis]|uniref:Nuclease n=1 Tax=Gryllotalpicola daejeonensis TaxID=993087 RepID=A0ABP7ZM52_9MICO
MSRTISSTVLPIQQAMAGATPSAWRDGLVLEASGNEIVVAFLEGGVLRLRAFDALAELAAGEPVAFHPVAEILDARHLLTTARVA